MGDTVGALVGDAVVGNAVGIEVGIAVGVAVGTAVGCCAGLRVRYTPRASNVVLDPHGGAYLVSNENKKCDRSDDVGNVDCDQLLSDLVN